MNSMHVSETKPKANCRIGMSRRCGHPQLSPLIVESMNFLNT
jgi:hypothetical protein